MRVYLFLVTGFLTILLSIVIAVYFFIHDSYLQIEDAQNSRIQSGLIHSFEEHLYLLKSTVVDHAQWDDTYDFMSGINPQFIDINFRENSNTLENLQVDIFQFLDKYNTPVTVVPQNSPLGKTLTASYRQDQGGYFAYENSLYAFYNEPITNTDSSLPSIGILQGASKLELDSLMEKNREIVDIEWVPHLDLKSGSVVKIGNTRVRVYETKGDKVIQNYFLFEQSGSGKTVGIKSTHPRTLYLHGRKTVQIFLAIVFGMVALVFGLLYIRQKEIQKEKIRLEETVKKRTQALDSAMNELRQAIGKLEAIAYIDELTGVRTRRSFFETCTPWFRDAKANNKSFCIAMMDLDDFKIINDTYGHGAGDAVLKDFCNSCEKYLDERMILARFGGEEFVIGFYGLSTKSAENICEKIQAYIGEKLISVAPHAKVSYTFSFGVACNDEAEDIDGILRLADERLYSAKERGKNLIRSR